MLASGTMLFSGKTEVWNFQLEAMGLKDYDSEGGLCLKWHSCANLPHNRAVWI